MRTEVLDAIESALGVRPTRATALSGGCVAQVVRAELPDGAAVVAKIDDSGSEALEAEAYMLRYLAKETSLPTPRVLASTPTVLVMEFIEGSTGATGDAEEHAAELLAALHTSSSERFGFHRDTVIGGLPQPNPWGDSWIGFFREQRLLFMAKEAASAGRLPGATLQRIHRFADRLDGLLIEPEAPALIHGDVWSGNVMSMGGRITALLDPAIYFADAEIELAFITLFSTFSRRFFDAYGARRPMRDGFFESRRDVYNLYPLLVHVRLFGGHYVQSVESTLGRFGA